uniref:Cyclic AMP-dependent transcription factor ATF-2 n=1 Tax=Cacopsylla melanoneura TaxID=428564 RepID=A0A8D9EWP6_9HEMI
MDKIKITLTTGVSNQEDQTPTPTKFLKQCEDIGLFNDLQKVNPFDETFKKAIDAQNTLLKYPLTVQNSDETLNTPTPYQIVGIDNIKIEVLNEPLPLVLEKDHLDLSTKQTGLVKNLPPARSPLLQPNIALDSKIDTADATRSPISDTTLSQSPIIKLEHALNSTNENSTSNSVIIAIDDENKTTFVSSKLVPSNSKPITSTSESIKNFILNKKKNTNKASMIVDNSNKKTILDHKLILKRLSKDTNPIDLTSYLNTFRTDNESVDSMVERLEALNSEPLAPEIQITPIPLTGNEKLPLPRKQSSGPDIPPPVRKKSRELSEEEKRQQILERNRLAAKRSRERQKIQQHALEHRLREKEKENKQLKLEIRNLKLKLLATEQEIDQLAHVKAQEMLSRALGNI